MDNSAAELIRLLYRDKVASQIMLEILDWLHRVNQDYTARRLAKEMQISPTTAYENLGKLVSLGIVKSNNSGRMTVYRISPKYADAVSQIFSADETRDKEVAVTVKTL